MTDHATRDGTRRYRDRLVEGDAVPAHFRAGFGDLTLGSVGLGTYLGECDETTDAAYGEALVAALVRGANVVDTAINYRAQRSERVVGLALKALAEAGALARDEIVVCSKGGYLPFDGAVPPDPARHAYETYVRPGVLAPEDIVGGIHSLAPRYLLDQIDRSLRNLQLGRIDVYYLHNPETQLSAVSRDELDARLGRAFVALELAVGQGKIGCYGVATWSGLRVMPDARDYLSLADLVALAERAVGRDHHFRAVQLPCNLAMVEGFARQNQRLGTRWTSVVECADHLGLTVVASAALLQGKLATGLPDLLAAAMDGCATDAQRALQFVRSTPGITTALVGARQRAHAEENLALAALPPAAEDAYLRLFTARPES